MINTIYMVKKDPTKPNSQDNWILMNIKEFNAFVKTPEAKGRYFADIGGHEDSDTWYVVECPKETAMKWRRELNRHYYLKRMEHENGYQILPYHDLEIGDEEVSGEEYITDLDDDFVVELMQKIDFEILEKALNTLSKSDYELIYALYLAEKPMIEQELADLQGVSQQAIQKKKKRILKQLKKFF